MKKGHVGPKNPLRAELEELKKQGIELLLDGQPETPKRISRACKVAEEGDYMRDYILNKRGDIQQLNFNYVKKTDK